MTKFISRLLLLVCLFPLEFYSQELEIGTENYSPDFYINRGFANRYQSNYYSNYQLRSASEYKLKKVSKVELYDSNNQLCWMAELDTAGKITRSGIRGYYYFIVTGSYVNPDNSYTSVVQYFDHQKLVRLDTIISASFSYTNADTSMHFSRRTHKIYKRGELINEQNEYYNEKYLNKPVVIDRSSPFANIIYYGEDPNQPKVYLDKKLKHNYDSAKLYWCQDHIFDHDFYATSGSGHADIHPEKLKKHPFGKKYMSKDQKKYFVDGEAFEEPSEYQEAMRCGSYYYHMEHRDDGVVYGYTRNEKGLQDNFYSDYYPVDTSKVAEAVPETSAGTKLVAVTIDGYGVPLQRRLPTPVRTVLYTFKYEYFEN
jgi:hypothetical protein